MNGENIMYKVLISFTDNVDGGVYFVNKDTYPRSGVTPSDERIAYLMGNGNKFGKPVIEEIAEINENPSVDEMTKAQLEAYAVEKNIDLGDAKNKADILAVIKSAEQQPEE